MSLDTKYRPRLFEDVIGQENTVKVVREFVRSGAGLHQSYLFCGGHGSGKCVVGTTLVPTQRGLLPISSLVGSLQVEPTDLRVVQEHGESQAAYTYRGGVRETVRVRTHMGYEIEGTPNHRIRVMGVSGEIEWRCLGDIRDGDTACIVPRGIFGPGADLTGFSYGEHTVPGGFQSLPFEAPGTLTPEWGRLMGYLIGDGRCDSSSVEVSNSEEETKADVLDLLTRLCGYGYGTQDKRSGSGLENLRCSRVRPRAFLEHAGVGRWLSGDKEVPWSILVSPAPVVREFLRGYLEADGSVSKSGIEVTTKSKRLAQQVHVLLLQFGVVARLAPKWVGDYGEYHRITVDADSYISFLERIGFVSERKSQGLIDLVTAKHARKTRLTNRYTVVPHQSPWVGRFYANLSPGERTSETSHYFRSRRDECACTAEKVARIVEDFPHADVGTHFGDIHRAGYYFDPVVSTTPGAAEVFDLNVPEGEMFAANGFMNHNTTMGRILGRALLCDDPKGGDPCDQCVSCRSLLERGSSECFTEFDAATNSGKDDIKKLTDVVHFDTFSGKRRIYLIDESHRLSPAALDALLKPMEDNIPGSQDKLLVCIFCTTEPEKMKGTIFSRCAPAFVIRNVTPPIIADRLAFVCDQEGIKYEKDALTLIAEVAECHIRDALKSVEGVSMLGAVDNANVRSYLRLNANPLYLKLLYNVGRDLPSVMKLVEEVQQVVSPTTAYERLSELALLAYRVHLGVGKPPSYWPEKVVAALGATHGSFLLKMASLFASRPSHPSFSMLACDLANLHFQRTGEMVGGVTIDPGVLAAAIRAAPSQVSAPVSAPIPQEGESFRGSQPITSGVTPESGDSGRVTPQVSPPSPPKLSVPTVTRGGVYVDPRGINNKRDAGAKSNHDSTVPPLEVSEFRKQLFRLVSELAVDGRGSRPT